MLPKGWAEKGISGAELAVKEAGIMGEAGTEPVGSYRYLKQLPKGQELECEVKVFALQVERLLDDWPERAQCRREWFTLAQAAMAVDEGELAMLLLHFATPEA